MSFSLLLGADGLNRAARRAMVRFATIPGPGFIPPGGRLEVMTTTQTPQSLDRIAFSATVHCLTGCAIGEVLGMVIGTALGFSDLGTIALAVVLAFFFGYTLTSLPLLRSGMALAAVVPIALASDTVSITVMEIVDNAIILLIPGAIDAGVGDIGFWAALAVALLIAGVAAFPVNRWLISRGKGHAVVHRHHAH
jgi:Domain of unknown function (DUF4396)